ncbi:MAG TPA: pantoate--beta-alanine ligase [Bacteroidia bacterium]|jgi:pantoate--beta-alanine ligase|nr:pantoate--beta-alanine ligase [Bacteroidia bacterium]
MIIVNSKIELGGILDQYRQKGKIIGFVPTMGALHQGHISLIESSLKNTDITVASIFVNPTQFNDKADLERYPRNLEKDAQMLEKAGCHVLFTPEVSEIYPEKDTRVFNFGNLDTVLEGAHRPGHFNGVAQVVSILFDIVKPNKAFFGSKDYQQLLIIKELTKQLKLNIEIVACPTLREPDGLAMSSRNMLLTPEERKAASLIPSLMQDAKQLKKAGKSISQIKQFVNEKLSGNPLYKLDYYEVCDAQSLQSVNSLNNSVISISLIACFVGKIRLIDNLALD